MPSESHINVDETGYKDSGRLLWTWCFRAAMYTVFKVSPSRGSDVLMEVLGRAVAGRLGCDYFTVSSLPPIDPRKGTGTYRTQDSIPESSDDPYFSTVKLGIAGASRWRAARFLASWRQMASR
ncbi:MAG: IS66 family transposase [Pirellulales bacterium]